MFLVFPRARVRVSVFSIPAMLLMLWLEGVVPFFILIFSAAVHEIGHILAMRFCGYNIRRLDILPMGALIVCPEGIPNKNEVFIALCGPFASMCCAAVACTGFFLTDSVDFLFAALVNLVLGVFNLLPIGKLDGGKALFCFLADKKTTDSAERICSAVSVAAQIVFVLFSFLCVVATSFNFGAVVLSAVLLVQLLSK